MISNREQRKSRAEIKQPFAVYVVVRCVRRGPGFLALTMGNDSIGHYISLPTANGQVLMARTTFIALLCKLNDQNVVQI